VSYGVVAGYGGFARDNAMMRFVDFLYGFPLIIFVILLQVYFKAAPASAQANAFARFALRIDAAFGGLFLVFVCIGLVSWLTMARVARGQTLVCKHLEYVHAARAVGSGDGRILLRHILPNILGPCIVVESLAIPSYILLETFLSFIGLGANPPTPSWGLMIAETYPSLRVAPWSLFIPAAALTLTTLAFNLLGDGLRDALDPTLRGR
jgi:oligopeptide transport system permease protein